MITREIRLTKEQFERNWNEHAEELNRLLWTLPMEYHAVLKEKIHDLKRLITIAGERRETVGDDRS